MSDWLKEDSDLNKLENEQDSDKIDINNLDKPLSSPAFTNASAFTDANTKPAFFGSESTTESMPKTLEEGNAIDREQDPADTSKVDSAAFGVPESEYLVSNPDIALLPCHLPAIHYFLITHTLCVVA